MKQCWKAVRPHVFSSDITLVPCSSSGVCTCDYAVCIDYSQNPPVVNIAPHGSCDLIDPGECIVGEMTIPPLNGFWLETDCYIFCQ